MGVRPESFFKTLLNWGELVNKLEQVSTLILNRIWSNFLSNISDIDVELKNKSANMDFASILHRYGIAFLNSVYVESQPENEIAKNNPVKTDDVFNKKIENDIGKPLMDKNNGRNISLFHLIFSCPLWGVYLNFNLINSEETNKTDNILIKYYFNLEKDQKIFNTKEDDIKNTFKSLTSVNFTNNIKLGGFMETKIDFRKLTLEAKENEVKKAMDSSDITIAKIKSNDSDMEKYVYVIRRKIQEDFAPRTVPSATVKEILDKIKNQ